MLYVIMPRNPEPYDTGENIAMSDNLDWQLVERKRALIFQTSESAEFFATDVARLDRLRFRVVMIDPSRL